MQLAVTKLLLRALQQRQLSLLEARDGVVDRALCFCAARAERLAGPQSWALRCGFRQSLEQHSVWQNRRADARHRIDQRLHRRLAHPAGAPAQPADSCRVLGRARHLAAVAHLRADRPDQSGFIRRRTIGR